MENKSKKILSNKFKNKNEKINKDKSKQKEKKKSKSELISEEIDLLNKRILNELPPTQKYSISTEEKSGVDQSKLEIWEKPYSKFKDLPISSKTIQGLNSSKYFNLTPIQRSTLPHSLGGRDILAASKTGSGKTLCFLIPILENLYRDGWVKEEGLAALILLPTRELAIQIFEVINKIGKYHNFSVGMVIGGNDYEKEKYIVNNMNILIGTPGRVLQHMSESYMFNADNLKMLVIDEADRILDEGFEEELLKLLNYLPKNRQTLLFSATLTRNLKRLVKIHMNSPEYINLSNTDSVLNAIENINKNELSIMKINNNNDINNNNNNLNNNNSNDLLIPKNLNQFYTIVEPEDRVNILYSFLKTHKTSKCLVFVSSRKQVRYFTEIFKYLKLGMLFLDIHGKQKQGKRSTTFYTFSQKRNSVVLFATDLASRGVDFPAIDWVIQLDPPEDLSQYIHRVGRTARYKSDGNSILFVSEKENNFINKLKIRKINILKMKIPPNKINNITPVIRSILSEHKELIELAEKAITSYIKSINLMSNKNVFDIKNIDLGKLALSYGLVSSPEMIIKSKKEVENEIIEENKKNIDLKNKKIEEEKNLIKDNIINNNNNDNNKKKSKLFKLKEKIKLKKLMKQKEKENENEQNKEISKKSINLKEEDENNDNEFLTVKKDEKIEKNDKIMEKNDNDEIKLGEKRKRKKSEKEEKNEEEDEEEDEEENEFYNKIKKRLNENKENDIKMEKERITIKHKEDRLKLKEKDYKKHGIEIEDDYVNKNYKKNKNYESEEDEEDKDENKSENKIEEEEEDEKDKNKNKEDIKNKKSKIKININHSTLKEKENAAIEILRKKGML